MEISQNWSKISPQLHSSHSLEISQGERGHLLAVEMNDIKGAAETKIEIRGLNKVSDKGDSILKSVRVDIPRGVIMGIIGPSGSGKSTILRALNRLWEPPKNTVFLDGTDICDLDVLCLRRKVGMLFQLPVLFEGMVVKLLRSN
uniref:Phosphate abc transporter n=2 Tax=Solanum tuberosum TaxID=4113 RepID=M1CTN8_SOLTU